MAQPTTIDVVVHLHGFSGRQGGMRLHLHKEPISGLDFHEPERPANVGRTRPTLAILPRGSWGGIRPGQRRDRYSFPALLRPGALGALIEDARRRFTAATHISAPRGRLILTAHSGGGAALLTILAHTDPDEVHIFDGLYQDPVNLIAWARRRIAEETAPSSTRRSPGALRVLCRPGTPTAIHSGKVQRALASALGAQPDPSIARRYRVEATPIGHNDIPRHFGWRLLLDPAADLPDTSSELGRRTSPPRAGAKRSRTPGIMGRSREAMPWGEDEGLRHDDVAWPAEFEEASFGVTFEGEDPSSVPTADPVPFAPPPASGYWPVRTTHRSGRLVSFTPVTGPVVGAPGRRFLANRSGTRNGVRQGRWHVGLDLFANAGDVVVACQDGRIVDFGFFYKARSGQNTYRLMIEHAGVVANYGEVTGDSLSRNGLRVGMDVRAGQTIGIVSDTRMLHFETYRRGTRRSHRWWKGDPRPPELLNPTKYLLFLRDTGHPRPTSGGAPAAVPPSRPSPAPSPRPTTPKQVSPTIDGLPLGRLLLDAPGRARFEYRFTPTDALWTAKLIKLEAGGRDDPDNAAVLWAMFNRYAFFTHRVASYRTFTDYLRAYSTTLQPVLRNRQAAARHMNSAEFVRMGGYYDGTTIPKGQLRRHLAVQAQPWGEIDPTTRAVTLRAMRGALPNPGIGNASEFASTRVYWKQHNRTQREPTYDEWRRYTEALGPRKRPPWRWIGEVPGIDQRRNAFFLDLRVANLSPNAVRVLPP